MIEIGKDCTKCGQSKPHSAFYNLKDNDNRFRSVCQACISLGHTEPAHILKEWEEFGYGHQGKKTNRKSSYSSIPKTRRRGT